MTSLNGSTGLLVAGVALILGAGVPPAHAAIRTFVASTGNDANACSRTAPCRTFGAAIAQTDAGGEVVVLDSAGYGPVTINKAVTLIAPPGVHAGITATTGNAITVNAGTSATVFLRGLFLNGLGGDTGIKFQMGKAMHVESCILQGFSNFGMNLVVNAPTQFYVKDTSIRISGSYAILIGSNSGTALGSFERVRMDGNHAGLYAGIGSQVMARDCIAAGNMFGGFMGDGFTFDTRSIISLENCVAIGNGTGIDAGPGNGATSVSIYVSNSTIMYNTTGLHIPGSGGDFIYTFGNNRLTENSTDGAFNGSASLK